MAQRIFAVSKILSVSDVRDKVALPAEIREHMQPMMNRENIMELKAYDRWGQEWTLKYCSFVLQTGKFKNPVFSGAGWRKIVIENGVRPGDRLIFSRDQVVGADGVLEYKIQVKRQNNTFSSKIAAVHDSGADGVSFYEEEVIKPKSQPRMTFQGQPM
ncbi:hypothetical protein EZV62_006399 [Acer yangbiense]|uniref:TF-B3 domain-containing protein n=1 Tax=Acer yangbiense TaxID=1000413 RepID=A0A5C7I7I6_9ROSI|nr:hypothetical protein EZV62_006399 [Acer yangbiense]